MARERMSINKPKARRPKRARHDSEDLSVLQQVGNRAIQRALAQRQGAVRPAFNPLDPAVIGAAARNVIAQNEAPVRSWLAANTDRLRLLTMDDLVAQVRTNVAQASRLADVEVQSLVNEWAAAQGITIPVVPPVLTGLAGPTIKIPDTVKKAFSIAVDGVDLVPLPGGRLNISAKGATAKLTRGDIRLSWGGSLGIDIPIEGFQLAGTLDKDHWELTLSTPGGSSMPDLTKLADVFTKGETALRGIIKSTTRFGKLDDVAKIKDAVTPHIGPIKEAVQTLVDIAKAPTVSGGISLRGPTRAGERPVDTSPAGITISATITIRF